MSLMQRLAPGSPLSLGGEALLSAPRLAKLRADAARLASAEGAGAGGVGKTPAPSPSPFEWSVGGSYAGEMSTVGVRAGGRICAALPRSG